MLGEHLVGREVIDVGACGPPVHQCDGWCSCRALHMANLEFAEICKVDCCSRGQRWSRYFGFLCVVKSCQGDHHPVGVLEIVDGKDLYL